MERGSGRRIAVIGAGEIFRRCYISANKALPPNRRFCFTDIIDLMPENDIRSSVSSEDVSYDFRYWKLKPDSESSLEELFKGGLPENLPFIISTPTIYHIPYAKVILNCGGFAAIEKPLGSSIDDIEKFKQLLQKHGKKRLFLFAYYFLEKGLPLLILSRKGYVEPFYRQLITLEGSFQNWEQAYDSLGRIQKIYGTILEGKGSAGTLDQRQWVLNPVNGGNTVETFYHLMCFIEAMINNESTISITDAKFGVFKELLEKYDERNLAESLTSVTLQTDSGIEIQLIAAKYVPLNWHQRWLFVICEHGNILMDFETQTLAVKSGSKFLSSILRWPSKYTTQFMFLSEKLNRPELPIEDETLLRALERTLQVRERLNNKIPYVSEELRLFVSNDFADIIDNFNLERRNIWQMRLRGK